MSTHKAAGKLKQHVRPSGKRLGIKASGGQKVKIGSILIRQRGLKIHAGKGVKVGKDHTIYSVSEGKVKFKENFGKKIISVVSG